MSIFTMGYLIFKYDIFKRLAEKGIINKDFSDCYILKYPKHAELHNKDMVYKIDFDEFFRLNPKLKGKITVIERPEVDSTKAFAVKEEVEARRKIKADFWEKRKKSKQKTA
ncbi:hypothetical protein [Arcobacter aquimarinus]|nr:hypothetical protein [Arcobacter aquimarinus]RXI36266.1 hypothetical protein CP986_03130 [Arcobacter aquimarinus]